MRTLAKAQKTKSISIRLSKELLDALKRRSEQQGIPYQTLITSILHRYATNRLVDQAEVGRVMEAVTDGNWQLARSKKRG